MAGRCPEEEFFWRKKRFLNHHKFDETHDGIAIFCVRPPHIAKGSISEKQGHLQTSRPIRLELKQRTMPATAIRTAWQQIPTTQY
jgi:hypothetical protein